MSWEILAGEISGIHLGHKTSVTSFQLEQPANIRQWDILRDDIGPQETLIEIPHEFNVHIYNSFILFPYEDDIMRDNNEYSGNTPMISVKPAVTGKQNLPNVTNYV